MEIFLFTVKSLKYTQRCNCRTVFWIRDPRGLPAPCPQSWSSVRREHHSQYTPGNQSAHHPPLCAIRDVKSTASAGYGLNPAAARRLYAFDLYSFKGLKCSHYCTLGEQFSLHYTGKKKVTMQFAC